MNEIVLTQPIASDSALERLNLFAGRHMGEDEFDRQQAYTDRRIASLLAAMNPGIVQGLEVRTTRTGLAGDGFTISPGLAIAGNGATLGLYYSLRETWATLIEDYLKQPGVTSAAGVFYLTLKRSVREVDSDPNTLPEQRTEFDPTRDERLLVVGTLGLTRLAIDAAVAASQSRERVENWVAANNVDAEFMRGMNNAVPLGLLLIQDVSDFLTPSYIVKWFSPAVGQYRAIPNSGYKVLLQQTRDAFRRMLDAARAQTTLSIPAYINANLHLDFLPSAGELPIELIQNIAARNVAPSIAWLPSHIAVDMVPAPEETVAALIEQHLPRRVVDLRQPAGERLRLLVAVNEPDFKPDLLDYPQTDKQLISDLFRYFARAHDAWRDWMTSFNRLYYLQPDSALDEIVIEAHKLPNIDARAFKELDLPKPVDSPQLPQDFFAQVILKSRTDVGVTNTNQPLYPYDEGIPAYPAFYQLWGEGTNPVTPKPLAVPEENGYVIQYAIGRVELEALDNQIRALRSRVEKTRDYLLLQRQQLDSQTVSLAALAGGVAGDGSGLQVARWLPFTQLKANKIATTQSTTEAAKVSGESFLAVSDDTQISSGLPKQVAANLINYQANTSIAKTAQTLATKASSFNFLGTKNLVFSNTLRQSPTVFSTVQFNLNNLRLNKIAEAPKQALTKPAFDTKEFRFGVLEHISPEVQEYKKAVRGINDLLTTVEGMFDKAEATIIKNLLSSLGKPKVYETIEKEARANNEEISSKLYAEFFNASRILTKQISAMESRYQRIEANLEGKLRARINKESVLEKISALIRSTTEHMAGIDKRRVEFLGDYGVTQRLIDDDWLDVFKLNKERTRILTTAVKGLYYLRVVQTPVGLPLADPLLLRYGKASDIVPGIESTGDVDLPDDLDDFFDTVLEAPMNDWASLRGLEVHIPLTNTLDYIDASRQLRIKSKVIKQQTNNVAATTPTLQTVSLFGIRVQTQASLHLFSQVVMPVAQISSKYRQEQVAQVIGLNDLLNLKGPLQKQAQTLHNRLELAIAGMLEKLDELPPSLRLQWAQLAEDDRLPVDRVEQWPGLERAERDDFNSTRTLAELIAWWFRQLNSNTTAPTLSAMRNMIRATLIHASLGDPAEILQGAVQIPPRRLDLGESLRLQLNRVPKPGTLLQLLDPQQRVVALLNVDDHDDKGTIAKISQVVIKNSVANPVKDLRITTEYRVVASKATAKFGKLIP